MPQCSGSESCPGEYPREIAADTLLGLPLSNPVNRDNYQGHLRQNARTQRLRPLQFPAGNQAQLCNFTSCILGRAGQSSINVLGVLLSNERNPKFLESQNSER
jgi:hypothetical protein